MLKKTDLTAICPIKATATSDLLSSTATDDMSSSTTLNHDSSHSPLSSYAQILRDSLAKIPSGSEARTTYTQILKEEGMKKPLGSEILPISPFNIDGITDHYFGHIALSGESSTKKAFISTLGENLKYVCSLKSSISDTEYLKLLLLTAENYASLAETYYLKDKSTLATKALTHATDLMQQVTEHLKNRTDEEKECIYNELVTYMRSHTFEFLTCGSHDFSFDTSKIKMLCAKLDDIPCLGMPVFSKSLYGEIATSAVVSTSEGEIATSAVVSTSDGEITATISNSFS